MTQIPCLLCRRDTDTDLAPDLHPHCVGTVRRHLIAVEQATPLLALELWFRGAPATPPDPTPRASDQDPLPGGDILVLLGPGSTGWHSDPIDVDSIIGVLEKYDTSWHIAFGEPAAMTPATITRCTLYLLRRLQKAADNLPQELFAEFARDIRKQHTRIESVLRDGPQYSPVPCIYCEKRTLQPMAPLANGHVYEYRCDHCHRPYTWEQFWQAFRQQLTAAV